MGPRFPHSCDTPVNASSTAPAPTPGSIFRFWVPLAATWIMMGLEGPFLAAVIARLADPTFNLAAYGVAYAMAILVEAPVIMLLSASTALVEDSESLRKFRNFTRTLNTTVTVALLVILIPGVNHLLLSTVLGLPPEVVSLVYGALWFLIPWPAAIGYRRFLHGLLIRSGRTRLVAVGTLIRLMVMSGTALVLYFGADLPGAWVGAAALSAGVVVEALAARLMAGPALRELQGTPGWPAPGATALAYRAIAAFYWPLALTSLIGLTVQPMLTFFMGRSAMPIESLAVFPVVLSLGFLFRTVGLSFQEAAIALLGRRCEHAGVMGRFAAGLALASSGALAVVAFTPLSRVWFEGVSGLPPELAAYALVPTMLLVPLPAMSVLLSFQRATLVQGRNTTPITWATALEVGLVALLFVALGWGLGWVGVTAAFAAFLGGRVGGNLFLWRPMWDTLARFRKDPPVPGHPAPESGDLSS